MNPFYEIIEGSKIWNSPELLINLSAQLGPNYSLPAHLVSKPVELNLFKKGFRICIFDQDESSVFYDDQNDKAISNDIEPLPLDIVPHIDKDLNEESTCKFNARPPAPRSALKLFYDDKGRKMYMPRNRGNTNTLVVPSLVPRLNSEYPETNDNDGTEEITKRRR